MSYLWTVVCFAGCVPLMLFYLQRYGTILAPASLFAAIWLFTVGMFNLGFVQYIAIDGATWAMLGGSGLCFLVGCQGAHFFAGNERGGGPVPSSDAEEPRILWTLAITVPLGLVGIATYVVLVGRMVGYDAFVTSPHLVRELQSSDAFRRAFKWARFLNYLNILNVALGAYYRVRFRGRPAGKYVLAAMIVGFATTLLAMDRTLPVSALTWPFFTAEFGRAEGRGAARMLTRLGALVFISVALFISIAEMLGKTLDNNRDASSYVVVAAKYEPLIMPYIYLTASIPAFQEFVHHTEGGATKGAFLLLPAAKIVQLTVAPSIGVPEEVGDYYAVPFSFNTHTWLDVFWSDFGYAGLMFVPLMTGFVATVLFLRAVRRPTLRTCMLSGLCSYVVINTVIVNKIVSTPMWEYALIILVMTRGLDHSPEARGAT